MEINSNNLKEDIQTSRPNLRPNTINQYITHLNKLKNIFEADNWNFLSEPDDIMEKLKDKAFTSQRNSLNAVIVLLLALNEDEKYDELISKYQKIRDKLNERYATDQENNKISEKQKANFACMDEVNDMLNKMKKEIKEGGLKKKENITSKEKELLMVYTIFSMLSKYPTRNDMALMELITKTQYNNLKLEDKKKRNYMINQKGKLTMVLNEYKTSAKYGEKKIDLDKDIEKILRMYIRILNKKNGDVLFLSSQNNPLSRNQISQLLLKTSKKYMNKAVSTTLMRKTVASDKFGVNSQLHKLKKEQEALINVMCHSEAVHNAVYIKEKE